MATDTAPGHDSTRWQMLAWQGILLHVPSDWNPGTLEGDVRKGFLRIEDDETVCLEAKWQRCRAGESLRRAVDRHLKMLGAEAADNTAEVRVRRNTGLVHLERAECESYECHGAVRETGLAVIGRDCRRIVLVRVLAAPGATTRRVLRSFRDCAAADTFDWSVYGLRFRMPASYTLHSEELSAGRLQLVLRGGGRLARALRVSFAEQILRRQSLREWFKQNLEQHYRRGHATPTETTWKGSDAVEAAPRRRGGLSAALAGRSVYCRAWHDTRANAIYVAYWRGPPKAEGEFDAFADSFGSSVLPAGAASAH